MFRPLSQALKPLWLPRLCLEQWHCGLHGSAYSVRVSPNKPSQQGRLARSPESSSAELRCNAASLLVWQGMQAFSVWLECRCTEAAVAPTPCAWKGWSAELHELLCWCGVSPVKCGFAIIQPEHMVCGGIAALQAPTHMGKACTSFTSFAFTCSAHCMRASARAATRPRALVRARRAHRLRAAARAGHAGRGRRGAARSRQGRPAGGFHTLGRVRFACKDLVLPGPRRTRLPKSRSQPPWPACRWVYPRRHHGVTSGS